MRIEVTLCDTCRDEIGERWPTWLEISENDYPDGKGDRMEFCSLTCLRDFVSSLSTAEENA